MWNIIIGIAFIVGGWSEGFVLRGTNSCTALVIVGIGLMIWGIIQTTSNNTKKD